jgi:hypothetical protein
MKSLFQKKLAVERQLPKIEVLGGLWDVISFAVAVSVFSYCFVKMQFTKANVNVTVFLGPCYSNIATMNLVCTQVVVY